MFRLQNVFVWNWKCICLKLPNVFFLIAKCICLKLLKVFVQIEKCICLKLQNGFVQISYYICPNSKMYCLDHSDLRHELQVKQESLETEPTFFKPWNSLDQIVSMLGKFSSEFSVSSNVGIKSLDKKATWFCDCENARLRRYAKGTASAALKSSIVRCAAMIKMITSSQASELR